MFLVIIKQIGLSIVFICLIHYLYIFFKHNLTVPKIKDLVNRPEQKYKEIYQSLEKKVPDIPKIEMNMDMKAELKNYLQGLGNSEKSAFPAAGLPKSNNIFNNSFQTL